MNGSLSDLGKELIEVGKSTIFSWEHDDMGLDYIKTGALLMIADALSEKEDVHEEDKD